MTAIRIADALRSRLRNPQLVTDGQWMDAWSRAQDDALDLRFDVTDKAKGVSIADVPSASVGDTHAAIRNAGDALPAWRSLTAHARWQAMNAWAVLMRENLEDLATLMVLEQGRPAAEARWEVDYALAFVRWFAEEGKRVYGDLIPSHRSDARIMVLKQPVGVCAGITPWNFPCAMVTRKAAPALAAGCTMVLKPAGHTPLSAVALANLALQAGIPAGVFTVLTVEEARAPEIGNLFTEHPAVRKITFTGSVGVGRIVAAAAGRNLKRVSLELGGNTPFIVFEDADLASAVDGAIASRFRNMGQTCNSANRIMVHAAVHERFVALLSERVSELKVGPGEDENVTQGPLIEAGAVARLEGLISDAQARGGRVVCGGGRHALGGTFFQPTVVVGVTPDMDMASTEIFGPVAAIYRFETDDEAIALANATDYGLAGFFFSRDLRRVFKVAERLECGIVGVNTGIISTEVAPFGGVKSSGTGREGSRYGIEDYLDLKYVLLAGLDAR